MNYRIFRSQSTKGNQRWLSLALAGLLVILSCNMPFSFDTPAASPPIPGPSVTLHEPAPGAQFTQGDSFVLSASADDAAGVIRLDLWVDDTLVISQSSPDAAGLNPLHLSYPMVAAKSGDYALVARAYNSRGEFGESIIHYVTVVEPTASAPAQQYAQYVVQAGDTLENIAQRLGVSVDDILRANPGLSAGQQLQPGQVLVIPMPKQPPVAAAPGPNGVQPVSVGPGGVQPGGGQPAPPPQNPAPNPPPPASQPSLTIKGHGVVTSPVYFGQACTNEPQATEVVATVEPPSAVKAAVVKYQYAGNAGPSPTLTIPMVGTGGSNFGATINAGGEAAQYLGQDNGVAVVWVEVTDANSQISVSPSVTLLVNFCPGGGGLPPNLPGILPRFLPGVPQQNPGIANADPSLFPAPGNQVFNPPGSSDVTAPQNVQASAKPDECKIKLTWTDARNETSYRIDRYDFGQPNPKEVSKRTADQTYYTESLPQPGKYGYRVTAVREAGGQFSQAPSPLVWVDLASSDKCKPLANFKRVFFRPVFFQAAQAQAFVQVTIGDLPTIRVPRDERTPFTAGELDKQNLTFSAPAPEQIYSQPGASLYVQVHGDGVVPNQPPVDLGKFAASHTAMDLTAPNAKDQTWVGEGNGFKLAYKVWLDNWLWNGQASDPSLPAPTNLKLNSSDPSKRVLTWDYDAASKNRIDGFIVYREYTCQGGDVKVQRPQVVSKASQRAEIIPANEPTGCACAFTVSAFAGGESARSAPHPESCTTAAPVDSVYVTFESLRTYPGLIPNANSAASDIQLNVNEFGRKSNAVVIENDRAYSLQSIALNGLVNNNVVTALIGTGQSPSLSISYSLPGLCQGSGVLKKSGNDWGPDGTKYSMTSTNGKCELVFSLKNVASQGGAPVAPNQPAPPPAGFGPGCPGNEGCAITFVNQTGFDIVKLDITRKSNGVIENPIVNPALVIPANGGSLVIKEFFDENYTYQATYGTWPQGAQAPTINGNSPVSGVFPGTAKTIHIHDPNAQNPDAQSLRRLLGNSLPWDLGAACSLDFGGYCSVRITFADNGTFTYEERPNAISPFMPVATGQYSMVSHNPSLQLFLVRLVSDHAGAAFPKDAVFGYGSAIFGVEIKSQRFGTLTFCSGACPQWVQP